MKTLGLIGGLSWYATSVYYKTLNRFVAGKHEVLPIPQTEVTLNNKMKQNPNW